MARQIKLDPDNDFDDGGTPAFRRRNADYIKPMEERVIVRPKRRSIWSKPRNSKEAVNDGLKIFVLMAGCILVFFVVYLATGFIASIIQSGQ